MGTKNNPAPNDCYANALPDEPMFILLGRDPNAPICVENWADKREGLILAGERPETDMEKVNEARNCARNMRRWRAIHGGEWRK